jgi:hypothetical protein
MTVNAVHLDDAVLLVTDLGGSLACYLVKP